MTSQATRTGGEVEVYVCWRERNHDGDHHGPLMGRAPGPEEAFMTWEARQPDSEAPSPALAEAMTRLADGPRSKWHDEVLPNGAGESWVCVPIGDVLAALPPSAPPALPPHTRLILASEDLLEQWGTRTEKGERISVEWGEQKPEGWYEPTFTVHADNTLALPALDTHAFVESLRSPRNSLGLLALPKGLMEWAVEDTYNAEDGVSYIEPTRSGEERLEVRSLSEFADALLSHLQERLASQPGEET